MEKKVKISAKDKHELSIFLLLLKDVATDMKIKVTLIRNE
tara:strand:- start:1463 stop:1582 length:120 start_codon:yes stop_codon:yes gene_type:complete